jgi:hypothetical protein
VHPAAGAVFAQLQSFWVIAFVFSGGVKEIAGQFATGHLDDDAVAFLHGEAPDG